MNDLIRRLLIVGSANLGTGAVASMLAILFCQPYIFTLQNIDCGRVPSCLKC
jgi:hypothetical protein